MARDRYDDDLSVPSAGATKSGLDGFFANTPVAITLSIVLFFCCSIVGAVLGLVGVLTCKDPTAKRNATIMLAVDGVSIILAIILQLTGVLAGFAGGNNVGR